MLRRLLLAVSFLASLSSLTHAQTLRIALREDPDLLDPTLARSYVGRIVFTALCDKLFDLNERLEIVPMLALSQEWTDPVTLILKLRPGVTFHNGEKLDAAAVKYSLERHLTLAGSFRRSEIASLDHVEAVDELTVRIVLKTPSAPFVMQLTDRAGIVLPPRATEAAGKDFARAPVCSGPFRFAERVAQDRIVLERFPGHRDAAAIHFDKVVYQPMPDSAVLIANLRSGAVDLAERVLPTDIAQVKADPRLRVVTGPALRYDAITFNLGNGEKGKAPIGQNRLLRQAFDAAIDRQALVEVVFNGMYSPTAQALPAASPYYVASVPAPPRDLARAKALIKQAGVATPVTVQINVPNTSENAQVAEVIQAMVKEAGFDLKINLIEFAASLQAGTRGEFEAWLIGWSGRADPDGNLYTFVHTGSGQNDGHYSNPAVDQALDAARASNDPAVRRAQYETVVKQLREDEPLIYLYAPVNIVAHAARLTGYRPVPDGMIRLPGMALAK